MIFHISISFCDMLQVNSRSIEFSQLFVILGANEIQISENIKLKKLKETYDNVTTLIEIIEH